MRGVLIVPMIALALGSSGQDGTTVSDAQAQTDTVELSWRERHSPARATLYSALLPGSGQVYNRKYWKVPIVLAGLGTSYYFIRQNRSEYLRYKEAYIAVVDGDPDTIDEFEGRFSAGQLLDVTDTYRRWMEWSYIAIGLVYLLNVVDAAVDAHFVRFDVSPDLTMGISPSLGLAAQGALGLHIAVQL